VITKKQLTRLRVTSVESGFPTLNSELSLQNLTKRLQVLMLICEILFPCGHIIHVRKTANLGRAL